MNKLSIIKMTVAGLLVASSLTGCASIVSGHNQPVSVNTGNVTNAHCSLANSKGTWYVSNTPGSTVINRAYGDLKVVCEKPGYRNGTKSVPSHTKGMAFGNVVFGGLIGAGVDVASGAAYDYPTDITVPMYKA